MIARAHRLVIGALVVGALGCQSTTVVEVRCTIVVHIDSLTSELDSVSFRPEEHERYCRMAWEHGR